MFIDSHCHLDFLSASAQAQEDALACGVEKIIVPAVSRREWQDVLAFAANPQCAVAYGLHPLFQNEHQRSDIAALDEWLTAHPAVAIGECGLDFASANSPELQRYFFIAQIELAISRDLPLIVHARKSLEEILQTLAHYPQARFVVHSFSGSYQQLDKLLEMGGRIGVGGTVTYPRAQRLRKQIAALLPADAYFLETDAPDQPLCGHQGQENLPQRVVEVAQVISELRGESVAEIAAQSSQNCRQFFNL